MQNSYTITKVSWFTQTKGLGIKDSDIKNKHYYLMLFLQDKDLVLEKRVDSIDDIDDDFSLSTSDLTDDGLALIELAHDKWSGKVERGMSPEDTTLLEKALDKVRKGKKTIKAYPSTDDNFIEYSPNVQAITKMKWQLEADDFHENHYDFIVKYHYCLVKFLQDNNLVRYPLIQSIDDIDDDFAVFDEDLTDDGVKVIELSLDDWSVQIQNGMDPQDISILDKALEHIHKK